MLSRIIIYLLSPPEGAFVSCALFSISLGKKLLGAEALPVFLTCAAYWLCFFTFRVFLKPFIKKLFTCSKKNQLDVMVV